MTTVSLPSVPSPRVTPSKPAKRWSDWFGPKMPFARWGLILNLLVPIGLLVWDARHAKLGANAINFAIHTTGLIAIICLAASLLVTPVRQVTGWQWLVQFRRSLGVYAFYYACAHLAIYFWWDRGRSVSGTVYEISHRYYLAIGFSSLALMLPLWATSFDAAIRWMGGKKWKWLHRLTYVAAVLAGVHYYLQSKSFKQKPEIYLAVVGGLLLWRVGAAGVNRVRKPARTAAKTADRTPPGVKAKSWKGDLRVIGTFRETPSVRTFRLAPAEGGPVPFAFAAGQFLQLSLDVDGQRVSRSYTIASPPTRDGYVELTVKREDAGQASHYLHDRLMTGQFVGVSAPAGRFTFEPKADTAVLLIAGGVGVTPVMAILRDLTDRCWGGKIDLVFSVKTPAEVIFAAELDFLAARHPNVHIHTTITRDVPTDWPGSRGRITADLLRRLVPDFAARRAFVCGPNDMAKAIHQELLSAGVDEKRIVLESFTPVGATKKPMTPINPAAGGQAVTLTFAQSDVVATLAAGQSVLEAAEAAGVPIDYQCRSGVCGTCRCKLLEGSVTMTVRDALSDADEADGFILACQAYAESDVIVDA